MVLGTPWIMGCELPAGTPPRGFLCSETTFYRLQTLEGKHQRLSRLPQVGATAEGERHCT